MVSEPMTALSVQHAAILTPAVPLAASKEGYLKIRLSYLTDEPKHIRSQMLQRIYGFQPPFVEDICILMPEARTFSILEAFIPAFDRLRTLELVGQNANLLGFKVLDEDTTTLAYLSE